MHKCPECGKKTLGLKYECGIALARCTNCEYVETAWPYYEEAIKKLRQETKPKTKHSPFINFL